MEGRSGFLSLDRFRGWRWGGAQLTITKERRSSKSWEVHQAGARHKGVQPGYLRGPCQTPSQHPAGAGQLGEWKMLTEGHGSTSGSVWWAQRLSSKLAQSYMDEKYRYSCKGETENRLHVKHTRTRAYTTDITNNESSHSLSNIHAAGTILKEVKHII